MSSSSVLLREAINEFLLNIGIDKSLNDPDEAFQIDIDNSEIFGISQNQDSVVAYLILKEKEITLKRIIEYLFVCARPESGGLKCHLGILPDGKFILVKQFLGEDITLLGIHSVFAELVRLNTRVR